MVRKTELVEYSSLIITLFLIIITLKVFSSFLRPLAFAIILAVLFTPLVQYSKKIGIPAYITLTVTILLLLIILISLTSIVVSEANQISKHLPDYQIKITSLSQSFSSKLEFTGQTIKLEELINLQNMNKLITPVLQTTGRIMYEIMLIIIFLIFIVPFYNSLGTKLGKLYTEKKKENITQTINKTKESVRKYLWTKTSISLGTALFSLLALHLFNSEFAVSLAIIIFLFNYIPNIGSIFAVVLVALIYFLETGWGYPFIALTIVLTTVQIVFGNILEPMLEGSVLKMSPLVIIVSLFFWHWLWGVGGMILAVPLTAIIKIILEQFKNTEKIAHFMS
jgi:AI-2 transport protein TqsA